MSTEKRLNIGYDSAVDDRGARFYIDGVQLNENKLTYIRKEEHAKLIIFYFTKYLQLEEQQTTNLLKFNIKTNEIIFRPANSLGTNRGGTLDDSNLPLARSNLCFPSDHFCIN